MSVSFELAALERVAARLGRLARERNACRLPPLLILTDPVRTPDPLALADRLPTGAGLVYRAFGDPDAPRIALTLARIARRRGLVFLVGADAALARTCGAQGVHFPERQVSEAQRLRAHWPGALITGAAHSARAIHSAAVAGLDLALISTIFPSLSPSAGSPMGPVRLAALARAARLPVYALGGVDYRTARRLEKTGVVGIAAIGAAVAGSRGDGG